LPLNSIPHSTTHLMAILGDASGQMQTPDRGRGTLNRTKMQKEVHLPHPERFGVC
jgi:hypothetical protein